MADEEAVNPDLVGEQAKQYARRKLTLTVWKLALTPVFLLVLLWSGASDFLGDLAARLAGQYYLQLGYYLFAFMVLYYVVFLGLDFYGGHVLEHRYGLSDQTAASWFARSVKQWLLSAVVVVLALSLLYHLIRHFPRQWWLLASFGWLLLLVLFSRIAPAVIVPLFYRCGPLNDRALADRLLGLARRCGVTVRRVFQIKLSKETRKANAAVVGLGRSRRILIGDTLLDICSHDEIEAVFAHELGHVRLHHSWKMLAMAGAGSVAGLYLLRVCLNPVTAYFGFAHAYDIAGVPLLMLLIIALGTAFTPLQNAYSRYLEKRADLFAIGHIDSPERLISALVKLARQNLADPAPGRLTEWLLYDHPSVPRRVRYLSDQSGD